MWQTLVLILELAGGFGRYFLEILRFQALNNFDSLTCSKTWFRMINYSDALVLDKIFFFSKSFNIIISLAAVA